MSRFRQYLKHITHLSSQYHFDNGRYSDRLSIPSPIPAKIILVINYQYAPSSYSNVGEFLPLPSLLSNTLQHRLLKIQKVLLVFKRENIEYALYQECKTLCFVLNQSCINLIKFTVKNSSIQISNK